MEIENINFPSNRHSSNKVIESNRIPLRPRNTNIDDGLTGSKNSEPLLVKKSSRLPSSEGRGADETSTRCSSTQSDDSERIEIEELRRRPDGEGHTVHKYLRGQLLGKGGFAKVYLCTALDTNRTYAVKIVPKANLVKTRARQKLQAEIKIHRTLKHPHVCEYKHYFEDKLNCYILLELCHNQSMNELIKRRKRLTEPEVKYYLLQLLKSVKYMHTMNVIHRDLKLGNLFLDKNLQIKVGDLGLATKLTTSDEKRQTICGTPNYIAPEVIDADKEKRGHSFEVDIWSMGVICYTLLVGKPPYESKDVKSTYQRILANKYSFPSHVPISEHARDLITRMLQTVPDKRPSIDDIQSHPFFTHDSIKIPESLPSCCLHVSPDWQEGRNGSLIPVFADKDDDKQMIKSQRSSSSGRSAEPLSTRNPSKIPSENIQRKNSLVSKLSQRMSTQLNIYEDQSSRPADKENDPFLKSRNSYKYEENSNMRSNFTSSSSKRDDLNKDFDKLCLKTASCNLNDVEHVNQNAIDDECNGLPESKASDVRFQSGFDAHMNSFERLHNTLRGAFDRASASDRGYPISSRNVIPRNDLAAKTWVTRYVDYTSKYGLGFLLNNGGAGVFFNDCTKAVLDPTGEAFLYVDRKNAMNTQDNGMPKEGEIHSLTSYPESLQKKALLLKHFRNYLIEQQKREDENYNEEESRCLDNSDASESKTFIFVKKWVRSKHAILFRLSNNVVQVVFYDQTEILIHEEGKIATYVDRKQERSTYVVEDVLMSSEHNDVKKRLKYAESMLHQLNSTSAQGSK